MRGKESITKTMYCSELGRDVTVIYYIEDIETTSGKIKKKDVWRFECDGKRECTEKGISYFICPCFRGVGRVVKEINYGTE